jgi:hypothetical protein
MKSAMMFFLDIQCDYCDLAVCECFRVMRKKGN